MSEPVITARCVRHSHGMFGCQVYVDGKVVAFLDGQMPKDKTLDQLEDEIVENRRRTMAEPQIVVSAYAKRIRDRRLEQRISLREVARRLKVSSADVSDLERGRVKPHSFRFAVLWAIASGVPALEAHEWFRMAEIPKDGDL